MIEGSWKLTSGEENGQDVSAEDVANSTLQIDGRNHTVTLANDELAGSHQLDTTANPMMIDSTDTAGAFAGQTLLGIFKVEDDQFTVCFAAPGDDRPDDFTTKQGTGAILHVWKR